MDDARELPAPEPPSCARRSKHRPPSASPRCSRGRDAVLACEELSLRARGDLAAVATVKLHFSLRLR